jgi:hypothetical protein
MDQMADSVQEVYAWLLKVLKDRINRNIIKEVNVVESWRPFEYGIPDQTLPSHAQFICPWCRHEFVDENPTNAEDSRENTKRMQAYEEMKESIAKQRGSNSKSSGRAAGLSTRWHCKNHKAPDPADICQRKSARVLSPVPLLSNEELRFKVLPMHRPSRLQQQSEHDR